MAEARSRLGAAAAVAGPLAIVAAVLTVLHGFAFQGLVSAQHPDLLSFWLPTHCFLGDSLAAGHIPAINPAVMGGLPFAADPQSGWLYLPAMLLYGSLPCETAVRWFVILQPLIAGLGTYAFLRSEGTSRSAATLGGLVLSLAMAGSLLAVSIPLAGAIAWTPVALFAASRFLRTTSRPGRIGWAVAAAAAWGQIAVAHLTHGLVVGTGLLTAFVIARLIADRRARRRTRGGAFAAAGLLVVALVAVNLAILVPRIHYIGRTTLGPGYARLNEDSLRLSGGVVPAEGPPSRIGPGWPLGLAASPGMHVAAVGLLLSFGALASRRHRATAVGVAAFGALTYALGQNAVAEAIAPVVRHLPRADVYLHGPERLRLGLIPVIAILAALGLEAWRERPRSVRQRALLLAPGLAVWGVLPPLLGVPPARLALAAAGAVAGTAALALAVRRPALLGLVAGVAALELTASGLIGLTWTVGQANGDRGPQAVRSLPPLFGPTIDAAAYVRPSPMVLALRARSIQAGGGRYISYSPTDLLPIGYVRSTQPGAWPLEANLRASLFGLEDAGGYNPDQLPRYWTFIRSVHLTPILYNQAVLVDPVPIALDLLDVSSIVGPAALRPHDTDPAVTHEGRWALYPVTRPAARACVVASWRTVPSTEAAIEAVTADGFDPAREAVLEGSAPALGTSPPPASRTLGCSATYTPLGPQAAEVVVDAPAAGIALVRNTFDEGWHATVDGREVSVIPTDAIDQGIPVPAGHHTIVLGYDDPWVGYGLLGTGVALLGMLGVAVALGMRDRAGRRRAEASALWEAG